MNFITNLALSLLRGVLFGRLAYSSTAAFIIINMIPVAGIVFLGWDIGMVVFSYLSEFAVYTFFISLHILTLGEESFFFERHWICGKIIIVLVLFSFVMIFLAPFSLVFFAHPHSDDEYMQCIATVSALAAGHLASFIRNSRSARDYHVEFFFQLIGPRFIYFLAALAGGYYLNTRFPTQSGILLLLPISAVKTLLDYMYEKSGYLKNYAEAFRLKK